MFLFLLNLISFAFFPLDAAESPWVRSDYMYQHPVVDPETGFLGDIEIVPVSYMSVGTPTEDGFVSLMPVQQEEADWEEAAEAVVGEISEPRAGVLVEGGVVDGVVVGFPPDIEKVIKGVCKKCPAMEAPFQNSRHAYLSFDYSKAIAILSANRHLVPSDQEAQCAYYEILGFLNALSKDHKNAAESYVQCCKLTRNLDLEHLTPERAKFFRLACREFWKEGIESHKRKDFSNSQIMSEKAARLGIVLDQATQAKLFLLSARACKFFARNKSSECLKSHSQSKVQAGCAKYYEKGAQRCVNLIALLDSEVDERTKERRGSESFPRVRKECLKMVENLYNLAACYYRDAQKLKEAGQCFMLASQYSQKEIYKSKYLNDAFLQFKNAADEAADNRDYDSAINLYSDAQKICSDKSKKRECFNKIGANIFEFMKSQKDGFIRSSEGAQKEKRRSEMVAWGEQAIIAFRKSEQLAKAEEVKNFMDFLISQKELYTQEGIELLRGVVSEALKLKDIMQGPLREDKRKELVAACQKALNYFVMAGNSHYAALACKHAMSISSGARDKIDFGTQSVNFFRQANEIDEANRTQEMVDVVRQKVAQGATPVSSVAKPVGQKLEPLQLPRRDSDQFLPVMPLDSSGSSTGSIMSGAPYRALRPLPQAPALPLQGF